MRRSRTGRQAVSGRPARTRRLFGRSAKPALPGSGATLPDVANGLSRAQHGYGTTRRTSIDGTPGKMALQRKLGHLEVPVSVPSVSRRPRWLGARAEKAQRVPERRQSDTGFHRSSSPRRLAVATVKSSGNALSVPQETALADQIVNDFGPGQSGDDLGPGFFAFAQAQGWVINRL